MELDQAITRSLDLQNGLYVDYYNINVHKPYALMAYHPSAEKISGSLLDRWTKRFIVYKVQEYTGMSLTEFLQLDMLSVITVFQNAKEEHMNRNKKAMEMNKELENQRDMLTEQGKK